LELHVHATSLWCFRSVYSSSVTDLGTVSMKDSITDDILTVKTTPSQDAKLGLTVET